MKTLYIMRHAKSSWKDMSLDDFERPLNKRGKFNAPFMGKKLKKKNVQADIILSSPALRAKTTAKIIAKALNYSHEIIFNNAIYESSVDTLHAILMKLDEQNTSVFLFGHNPDLNMLAEFYVDFDENIPTCGVVKIEFDCKKWLDIRRKNAKLVFFDYPKNKD